jgi:hypothetical protein
MCQDAYQTVYIQTHKGYTAGLWPDGEVLRSDVFLPLSVKAQPSFRYGK